MFFRITQESMSRTTLSNINLNLKKNAGNTGKTVFGKTDKPPLR